MNTPLGSGKIIFPILRIKEFKFNLSKLILLFLTVQTFSWASTMVSYEIDAITLSKGHPNLMAYKSQINFPRFIGWNENGKGMLFCIQPHQNEYSKSIRP